jgi:hypothetical protein
MIDCQLISIQVIHIYFITDDVANLPGIKPIDLAHVQRARLHLGITTKADISTSDDITLCDWALNATDKPRESASLFPGQERT